MFLLILPVIRAFETAERVREAGPFGICHRGQAGHFRVPWKVCGATRPRSIVHGSPG